MAGGNRAYTLQDILGQLNGEIASNAGSTTSIEVNQLVVGEEVLGFAESASCTTGAASFKWDAAGANWGSLPWQ
jgi:hypothetical protein